MPRITIESKPVDIVDGIYHHAYLLLDLNDTADENDLVLRGGDGGITIDTQISVPIELSDDARVTDTPTDRGSSFITDEDALDKWSIMVQLANQIQNANITYKFLEDNSNSVITTLLHSIGLNIESFVPSNTTLDDLPGAENILDFSRNLTGTSNANFISGWQQNDTITGDAGNDTLLGASGNDSLYGGAGNDLLYGGAGSDVLDGGSGSDVLVGGGDGDTYRLSSSNAGLTTVEDDTGTLLLDGATFAGTAIGESFDNLRLGGYLLAQQGANLLLTNEANPANQILLNDFTSGDYGIVTGTDATAGDDWWAGRIIPGLYFSKFHFPHSNLSSTGA